jgi:hypothetical protein
MTRTTYDSGNHDHSINGHSAASSTSITNTGNNEKYDNRPPYYVVAYIVFLDLV